jgi:hypothetical protein
MLRRPLTITIVLVMMGFGFCAWSLTLERPSHNYTRQSSPIAIAVAFDLSPSMLAIPDPSVAQEIPPRYIRARSVLLELFGALQERRENVLVALIGFTRNAEVLMGWDNNSSQLSEMIEYGLSPGLFTSTGTSMEAAVSGTVEVFEMLPVELRETSRRIAVLVSDGEDTMPHAYLGYALEELASGSFDVIALQTGLLDTSEGVPSYGQVGEFLGFEAMGGELYTVPSAEAMHAMANATSERGLHVRAEDPFAVEQLMDFTVDGRNETAHLGKKQLAILGMFAVVALLCARLLQ